MTSGRSSRTTGKDLRDGRQIRARGGTVNSRPAQMAVCKV